jgi:hypothetical protein
LANNYNGDILMIASLFALAGAFIYRMRGGMPPSFPRPIDQALFAAPYMLFTMVVYYHAFGRFDYAVVAGAIVLGLTVLALVKGHGRAFRLNEPMKPGAEPEDIEWPIRWLEGRIPLYWYKVLIHVVSGLSYTLPAGIITLNPFLALSGALKAPAYMLSERAGAKEEGGELLTGALLWGAVAAAWLK